MKESRQSASDAVLLAKTAVNKLASILRQQGTTCNDGLVKVQADVTRAEILLVGGNFNGACHLANNARTLAFTLIKENTK